MNDWSHAFLEQAKSDFNAAGILSGDEDHRSQSTMLLQMAWEKLAKAALSTSGSPLPPQQTHAVAAKFVSALRRSKQAQSVLFSGTSSQFEARMTSLRRALIALERLTPKLSQNGMNAEYPWKMRDSSGREVICWPAKDITREFSSPRSGARFLRTYFNALAENFDRIFA